MSGGSWPNYVRQDWDADDEEIRGPPTTHLVATVDDLTDMLDFDSEDIDGMDDDAGDAEEPLLGNVVISKKFLHTRKIMVMHSNERGECVYVPS